MLRRSPCRLPTATLYCRITWRLIPLRFLCSVINYIDRLNIGFAQLQMKGELGFSDAVYGLGAGIVVVGYFAFEVPSNPLMQRLGARVTLLRIIVLWGLASSATMLVRTPMHFYVVRFLLGVFEAGFFPVCGLVPHLLVSAEAAGAHRRAVHARRGGGRDRERACLRLDSSQ